MDRRQFMSSLFRYSLSIGFLSALPLNRLLAKEKDPNPGMWFIDAHSHPYSFYRNQPNPDDHTFEMIHESGLVATSIAAVGDYIYGIDPNGSAYSDTLRQLAIVQEWEDQGYIRIIRKPQQIRRRFDPDSPIDAIVTIEGGDAIEDDIDHLDEFYEMGVRMITLVHNDDNYLGKDMRNCGSYDPADTGLTDFGHRVVERMNELGILVDVAHSSARTVFDVSQCTKAPVIDSHTNPLPPTVVNRGPGRLRTYGEMEAVVETGGVVCTWPLAYDGSFTRRTFGDWVKEIIDFKDYFGIKHIGLGTDSGGGLPDFLAFLTS